MSVTVEQLEAKIQQVSKDITKMLADGKDMAVTTLTEYKLYLQDELRALREKNTKG